MCRVAVFPVVAVLIFSSSGILNEAASGERNQPNRSASATTHGTYWYYGDPEYRCRQFSTVCGYYRPRYYGRYRSTTYVGQINVKATTKAPAQLGRFLVDDVQIGTEKTALLKRYGAFTRIEAPGNAVRWVRSDTLKATR